MTPNHALKAALESIFRSFAYLDLHVSEADREVPLTFSVGAEVTLGVPAGGVVALFLTGWAGVLAADNFIGAASTDQDREDVVRELANVIAGSVRSFIAGTQAQPLGIPRLLPKEQVERLWQQSTPEQRLVLADEEAVLAAVVLNVQQQS